MRNLQPITSKLPGVGTTIFTVMSNLAAEHRAINLSQGFPDFNASDQLLDRVHHYMAAGHNQYAPMPGVLALREMIARKTKDLYGADYAAESEITVTSGATEALYCAISAVVQAGDDVIIFEPAFDSYAPAVQLNGGVPVYIQLRYPDYHIDWDEVNDRLTAKTRAIILNSPHNPTGTVLAEADIAALIQISRGRPFFLISDEVYEHIIFDGRRHASLARYPELTSRSFIISSFGKTYHTTGWKIGYCLAPPPLSAEFRKIHQYLTFAANTPIQLAYADILKEPHHYQDLGRFYQNKRDLFVSLTGPSRFKPLPCHGTYFQMMDYAEVSDEPDVDFARRMTIEHGVAAIPPSVFYHRNDDHRVLRFCFAKMDETLRQAAEILCSL